MVDEIYSIAVDGPAGSGKSTISKITARELGIEYIDTGAMYRALTLKVLRNKLNPKADNEVMSILDDTDIDFEKGHIYLDGEAVDEEIRQNIVSQNVSFIAAIKEVREKMVRLQQKMAKAKSIIMDGRDITTVVLPDASFKIFLTASVEVRAKRRYKELLEKGEVNITLEQVMEDIEKRDYIDSNRKISPLTRTEDSILLDTSRLTIQESVDFIVSLVRGNKHVL